VPEHDSQSDSSAKIDSQKIDPHMYLHPQTLARLSTMELRAKMIVEGVMAGQHRSPYTGVSVEFAQHRQYVAGDDIRHLDWKVYARTDKLMVKQYQQETTLDLVILVDSSGSMKFGSRLFSDASGSASETAPDGRPNWSKFDHATATAAALSYITIHQGDRVGLAVYGEELGALVDRSARQSAWKQIVDTLATQPIEEQTDILRTMDQILAKVNNRCLFVIVSDFFDDPDNIKAAFAKAKHRGHDLIALQVLDKAETSFEFDDPAAFIGMENEPTIRIDPRSLKKDYLEAINAHIELVSAHARSFGFDHQIVPTHEWLGPTLASFVARRNAASSMRTSR
tara:strand:- start:155 stop:1171 length:1017 start_codon:yes stop_codon:yes gene_type:complete